MKLALTRCGAALVCASGLFTPAVASNPRPVAEPLFMTEPDRSFQDGRTLSETLAGIPGPSGILETGDPEDLGPYAACFDADHPPTAEAMAMIENAMRASYDSRYNIGARWNLGGTAGDPINITWSFVPDTVSIPGGSVPGEATSNSNLFARMDSLFGGAANRPTWIALFDQCFARWSALSGVNYTRVSAPGFDWDDGAVWGSSSSTVRGHIRISMHPLDGANGVLAYNAFPQNGDMVMDSGESWNSATNNFRLFRNTIMHEHGHGLGFHHVCPINGTKLMEPLLATNFDGPQQDEIRAVQENYGDPYEPNDNFAAAAPMAMGPIASGGVVTLGPVPSPTPANSSLLGLSPGNDVDYYSFTIDAPRLVDFTITPIGSTYGDWDQSGGCPASGPSSNALAQADLIVTAYASNGTTPWRAQNETAIGQAETISDLLISPAGTYYVKVSSVAVAPATQAYRLVTNVNSTALAPTASDGTFDGFVRITWPNIPGATSYQVVRNTVDSTTGAVQVGSGTVNTLDDSTAVPNTPYFYFVRAQQPGNFLHRFLNTTGEPGFAGGSSCDSADYNGDGDTGTDLDIEAFFACLAGSCCAGCPANADFNGDGDVGTDLDIEAFFRVLGGGPC